MTSQPKVVSIPISEDVVASKGLRRPKRQTARTQKLDLLPIMVEADVDEIGFRSYLLTADDLGITHALISSWAPPVSRSRPENSLQFGLVPIGNFSPFGPPSFGYPAKATGDLRYALTCLDATDLVPDDETLWTPWRDRIAKWRCREGEIYSSFTASPLFWKIFGHPPLADDDDGFPADFLDISFCSVGNAKQDWAPFWDYKGPFPFTVCFQIKTPIGCRIRWVTSTIDKFDGWYVGLVQDITPKLATLEGRICFELPETSGRLITGGARHLRPGVFIWLR
ncbi:MAG: hypothetical protein E5X67_06300 [Mesorhizobium sp.]|uniref:hypothetical protein n=1 Tax=Mesorhizobium sp. TaxID=1871066 RepID=UPI0012264E7A|nr:hypothetical protein [Mesorhizobium sp.]TIP29644.1 MAG: hypothetical protein E5X67_06300 [Mesorhizobium sp.]